ncbi:MAG: FAD-dependent oxidoreductase [Myxococcota bacterium]
MSEPKHVVVVVGGAVAGAEAASVFAERGAKVVVVEQNRRPYGKIEDGLPRWHEKLRHKEYDQIDKNLTGPGVRFVPNTRLGDDVQIRELLDGQVSAIVLAHGAWRDRPLPIEGAEAFVGKGLVYQNPFVFWFNHYEEPGYEGPRFEVLDNAVVVGGGLASIDVAKIINFELYRSALRDRGHSVGVLELEHKGIPKVVEGLGLQLDELGIAGSTIFYRRRKQDMPLATADNPTPEMLEKLQRSRVKLMDVVARKYRVRLQELARPVASISEDDQLVGLRFRRTRIEDRRVKDEEGSDFEVRSDLIVSSIGSIPMPVRGIPMKGELYEWSDWDKGRLEGYERVFGLGNVLTGKGNIKASRKNAQYVSEFVASGFLGVGGADADEQAAAISASARAAAEELADSMGELEETPAEARQEIDRWVDGRWSAVGYSGDYRAWVGRSSESED